MNVIINGQRVTLRAEDALGDGGEATVTRYKDLAVKLYRAPSAQRSRKLAAMLTLLQGASLPDTIVGPRALVHDNRGEIIGFAMSALDPGHEVLASLSKKTYRAQARIGPRQVVQLFRDAHTTLNALHKSGLVIGDFNDLNELFVNVPTPRVSFIDVDSFQLSKEFPCEVATETFLDPNLYGPDLAAPVVTVDGKPRMFTPANDWYSFAVLLFRSLTLVHPYGGVDPSLPTLPRRAHARRSVFAKTVRYPSKVGYALDILSPSLTALMEAFFDRGERKVVPLDVLQEYEASLRKCTACGLEYPSQRAACPGCSAKQPKPVVTSAATGCKVEDLFSTDGPVLTMYSDGKRLSVTAFEGSAFGCYRYDNGGVSRLSVGVDSGVLDVDASVDMVAWVKRGGPADLMIVPEGRQPVRTTTDRVAETAAAFAVTDRHVYRIASGMVMRMRLGTPVDERPVATVTRGQTWLRSAKATNEDILLGCSRIFGDRHYFLLVGPKRVDLDVAAMRPAGSVVEEDVVFSSSAVAVLRRVMIYGAEYVESYLIGLDGQVTAKHRQPVSSRLAGAAIHGAALSNKSLVIATDRGIVRERFDEHAPVPAEQKLFDATEPFVSNDSYLRPFRGGLAVAHGNRVRLITLT